MPPESVLTHFLIAMVAGLPAIILAIATLWKVVKQGSDIQRTEIRFNGRLDELVKTKEEVAWMKGHASGFATARKVEPYLSRPASPLKPDSADDTVPGEQK